MTDPISLDGVPAASLRLLGEDVLVRPAPLEEERASGLLVTRAPSQNFLGDAFFGEVVAVGPGRLVETGPSPEEVADFVEGLLESAEKGYKSRGVNTETLSPGFIGFVHGLVADFLHSRQAGRRVPTPWKPGDTVMVRQGFGPEVQLREGRHHIVGRGNSDHGHGILAAWTPGHVHCFHRTGDGSAECRCGERRHDLETRLPACSECPSGERLAEAVLGGRVADVAIPSDAGPGFYEERPVDDGMEDV